MHYWGSITTQRQSLQYLYPMMGESQQSKSMLKNSTQKHDDWFNSSLDYPLSQSNFLLWIVIRLILSSPKDHGTPSWFNTYLYFTFHEINNFVQILSLANLEYLSSHLSALNSATRW